VFPFEKLDIWQRSSDFADRVYDVVDAFPAKERFGLGLQLSRAATSISANIAEGSSRISTRDFSRFVEIAYGSLCEVVSHLRIAKSRRLVTAERHQQLYLEADELGRMLTGFRTSLGKWKTDPAE